MHKFRGIFSRHGYCSNQEWAAEGALSLWAHLRHLGIAGGAHPGGSQRCPRGSGCGPAGPRPAEGGGACCSQSPPGTRRGLGGASSLPAPAPAPAPLPRRADRAAPPLGGSRLLFWQSLSA